MKYVFFFSIFMWGCIDAEPKVATNSSSNNLPNNLNNSHNSNNLNNSQNTNNPDPNAFNVQVVDISDLDRSCEWDGDCVLVADVFCSCTCPGVSINQSEMSEYETRANQIQCDGSDILCGPCVPAQAACWQGECTVREPYHVAATNWDNSCEIDEDCRVVVEGELCSACRCGGEGVNRDAYETDPPPQAQCTPGPDFCDCEVYSEATCDGGTCVAVTF